MTNSMHAVMLKDGVWSALDTARTLANAVTPGETAEVGRFVDLKTGRNHGWIISDSTMTLFDFPGSVATNPMGINPAGDIVGWYRDVALIYHAFFLHSGEFTPWISPVPFRQTLSTSIQGETSSAATTTR